MAEQDQDKTEQATPYKLREARKQGQVAKSVEWNSFLMIFLLFAVFIFLAEKMIADFLKLNVAIFSNAQQLQLDIPGFISWIENVISGFFTVLGPMFFAIVVVAVVMNLIQTGPIFSVFPLKPDIKRINPVEGFKRVFSKKMIFDLVKTIIKLIVFSAIVYLVLSGLLPSLIKMMQVNPDSYARLILKYSENIIAALLGAIFIIALLDLIYTRWEFSKKMMMSRREMKDEIKKREGDPQIRSKIKEVQREAAKRTASINRVSDADVLITNPTHLAVAIRYKRHESHAPEVIAKGAGELAEKMKKVARKKHIPILENKPLARKLFRTTAIDQAIPEDCFAQVARILLWVYANNPDKMVRQQ